MRKEFCRWIADHGAENENVVFITGDLGYLALEQVRVRLGKRFLNAGVAEQNMISFAAGLARESLVPFCYSIAPFAVFRPAEQIRVDVCLHRLDVKIIGNGGGYGYGIMGATHHAIEDLAFLSSLQHMRCFIPIFGEDVASTADAMMDYKGPSYLRLGAGNLPASWPHQAFAPIRKWIHAGTPKLTVVALGPATLLSEHGIREAGLLASVDLFSVSQLPLAVLSPSLVDSLRQTRNLLVVEEHVVRGGLAEHLSLLGARQTDGFGFRVEVAAALGYPDGRYGNQDFHQKNSRLDAVSLGRRMRELVAAAAP